MLQEDLGLTRSLLLRPKTQFHIWEMKVEHNIGLFLFTRAYGNKISALHCNSLLLTFFEQHIG